MAQSEPSAPARPSRPRWYQFVLWMLLLLLMTCVGLSIFWSHSARQQRHAVAALRGLGGDVWYDSQSRDPFRYRPKKSGPGGPKWLVDLLGVDYFANVHVVSLAEKSITDADLIHLEGLSGVEIISLSRTQVTDAGLVHLQGLTDLQDLYINGTQVSAAGVTQLKKALPNCWIYR